MALQTETVLLVIVVLLGASDCQPDKYLDDSLPESPTKNCKYLNLPILDLQTDGSSQYLPPATELTDQKKLLKIMGDNFDDEFMSIEKPKRRREPLEWKLQGDMPEYIKNQNLRRYPDGTNMRLGLPYLQSRKKFRKWLWGRTHCPVKYVWKNLGKRFWPRWLKVGECYQTKQSCSIPSGLTCLPSISTSKNVLFWGCIRERQNEMYCRWITVPYPVITECKCGGECDE
ncbi:noggin-like isoform X2 [Ptychodera flava]